MDKVKMVRAYVKIDVRGGFEKLVRDKLRSIPTVKSADRTSGEQDIMVLVEVETVEALLIVVSDRIRRIEGVEKTVTNLVLG